MIDLAGVAAGRGQAESARFASWVPWSPSRADGGGRALEAWQPLGKRDLADAREQLGAEAFDAAWAEGQAMTFEEAVVEALAEGS